MDQLRSGERQSSYRRQTPPSPATVGPSRRLQTTVVSGMAAREALGLPLQGPISPGQLIPAFHHSGMPAEAPLTSRQITKFLKLLQCPDIPPAVTSHSVKTTCLTWAAMAGVPLDQRRLLDIQPRSPLPRGPQLGGSPFSYP